VKIRQEHFVVDSEVAVRDTLRGNGVKKETGPLGPSKGGQATHLFAAWRVVGDQTATVGDLTVG
jgi:hypothetical protein